MIKTVDISHWFLSKLITSPVFFSGEAVKSTDLLFPPFYESLKKSIADFNKVYPKITVEYVETYRSNTRQLMHYNNGASGIRKDGMHHFGIAADLFFRVQGKLTYKGDYTTLRKCHKAHGLHILYNGDIGHVQFIPVAEQKALRLAVKNAVIKFQKMYNLTPDGIPGKNTIAMAKGVFK